MNFNLDIESISLREHAVQHALLYQSRNAEFITFYGHTSDNNVVGKECLSQFYPANFKDKWGHSFTSAEQYMMYRKAMLFGDLEIADRILQTHEPHKVKKLGRQVSNFNQLEWDQNKVAIVKQGNAYKFAQNENLQQYLMSTQGALLVEAAKNDRIWGVGCSHARAKLPHQWEGLNLLGFILTDLRDQWILLSEDIQSHG